jgi:hypothetical protein
MKLLVRCLGVVMLLLATGWLCWVGIGYLPFAKGENLYLATCAKNYGEMREWLDRGADPYFRFESVSSMDVALEERDARAVAILLNYGASDGRSALLAEKQFAKEVERQRALPENQKTR